MLIFVGGQRLSYSTILVTSLSLIDTEIYVIHTHTVYVAITTMKTKLGPFLILHTDIIKT